MSVSKRWVSEDNNVKAVLKMYRTPEAPIMQEIATRLKTTYHNVQFVCRANIPKAEFDALQAIRYSRTKLGSLNPMHGKTGDQHHNWIGLVDDGYGYLTCLKDGKRQFVHRIVMAEALGLKELPEVFDVHHINEDTKDNNLDNLALATRRGHQKIHYLQAKDTLSVILKKSKLREALKYLTSQ